MNQPKNFNPGILIIWLIGTMMAFLALQAVNQQPQSISFNQLKKIVDSNSLVNKEVLVKDNKVIYGQYRSEVSKKIPSIDGRPSVNEEPSVETKEFIITINPQFDSDIINFLKDNGVQILYKETPKWLNNMIFWILGLTIFFLIFSFAIKRMNGGGGAGGALSFGKSKFQKVNPASITVELSQVAGIDEVKSEVEQIVDFLKQPTKYAALGAKIPKGVLLSGPPGTGKTMLAKAIAKEANVPFLSGSGSGFVEMFVGVGASRVRDLFDEARKVAPCIIFIDELDAIGKKRGGFAGGGNDEREQTLNQLLVEMDGFSENSGVIVIAATNRPDVLDSAFTRPGRFDRKISVGMPNKEGRKKILESQASNLRKMPLAENIDFDIIARGTPGFSGAELANLVNEAALEAAKSGSDVVDKNHFESAKDKLIMGLEQKNLTFSEEEKWNTAIHEAGHTVINVFYKKTLDPIHKVTIVPRGRAAGVTQTLPLDDGSLNYSDTKCNHMIQMLMGGRLAEEVFFNNKKTTGASNDIEKATSIARYMVYNWGMSKLGFLNFDNDTGQYDAKYKFSEKTRSEADAVIREIIDTNYKEAKELMTKYKSAVEELATKLMEQETLDSNEVYELLEKHIK